jgi:dTDP-4-dehydrorhamnose reductase
MRKLIVTGASGFLGWNICRVAKNDWDLTGIVFSHPVKISGAKIVQSDLRNFNELKKIFQEISPDAVIHTAAMTDLNYCQENRSETHNINVDASITIAALCSDYNIPYVFTSSDMVFNGLNPPYKEEDPVCPINVYGEQKVRAEEAILENYSYAAICRLPLMFGDPGPVAASFIQPMIDVMKRGGELRLFVDEFRTPISAKIAALGLLLALEKVKGIIHLGGTERISRYDFGRLLAGAVGFSKAKLLRYQQKGMIMKAPRPPDVSFNSARAFRLGFKPLSIKQELKMLFHNVASSPQ